MNRLKLLLVATLTASPLSLFAQNVAPVVTHQIADITEYTDAPIVSIDLANAFNDPDVTDAVRFSTVLGDIDIALFSQQTPITVANFLKYVDQGRYFTQGSSSFVHRSIAGFIIQGGGWIGTTNPQNGALQPTQVLPFSAIQNEAGISNKRGTIAMAQTGSDANSATSQWFINLGDNGGPPNNLDSRTGSGSSAAGPYAVFGRVANGMSVVDAIAQVPRYNFSGVHPAFASFPLINYTSGAPVLVENLVSVPGVSRLPALSFSVSTDSSSATVTLNGTKLLVSGQSAGTTHVTVTATDLDGGQVSQMFTVNLIAAPGRLVNLSTRMQVGSGDNALIAGFILRGTAPKRLAIRAIGSSSGLSGAIANPTLELHDASGATIAANDNWGNATNKQDIIDLGLAPGSPNESVILTAAPSNDSGAAYTAVMRGVNNTTGLGVVEVYDLDSAPGSTLLNISTRGQVGADPNALIGGFILGGTGSKQILIRAIGPSLTGFGVAGALADPTLELRNAQGGLIDSNDDWVNSPQKTQIENSTLAPSNSKESAIVQPLAAGQYTAVVHGANGGTGVGSVEVYQLP
jgi:cyclophilin family peptidyl-prolyl cis-trans isomerase